MPILIFKIVDGNFEHPDEQMLEELAQISGRGAAAESTAGYVNRHDLKGEGGVKKERLREYKLPEFQAIVLQGVVVDTFTKNSVASEHHEMNSK